MKLNYNEGKGASTSSLAPKSTFDSKPKLAGVAGDLQPSNGEYKLVVIPSGATIFASRLVTSTSTEMMMNCIRQDTSVIRFNFIG